MKTLKLTKGAETRIQHGSLWGFSNEIEDLRRYTPGEIVAVENFHGNFLGTGYVNPHSLIALRIVSSARVELNRDFFVSKLRECAALRDAVYGKPYYRLVHSEGDLLPGLVIDRYGDVFSVQVNTYGMDILTDAVTAAMKELFGDPVIILKNDSASRKLEGLEQYVKCLTEGYDGLITFEENGVKLQTNILTGQKTGYYFDQRENRKFIAPISKGKTVYDVFSYIGGWGLNALRHGAKSVTFVDASEPALRHALDNVKLNGFAESTAEAIEADAVEYLKHMAQEGIRPDILVVDPPAYIKSKKTIKEGEKGYINLNKWAFKCLDSGSFLFTFSCSHHMERSAFAAAVAKAARAAGKQYRILHEMQQGLDHPVNPHMAETFYLKGLFIQII